VKKDLAEEIKELNKRISELEKMLSVLIQPLQNVSKTTQNYMRITGLLLDHGGLTPDLILPEVKDPISREIVRVLLDRNEQNVSQITELVKSKRGTASRRIIREKIQDLIEKDIVQKQQKGSRYVYSLTEKVIKKWSQMLGFNI
jgi:DNA-binding transcriptional ArsR family regulator